ncbi:MAG: N-acyl-D-amino-acid deacylase family protein [Candidatus Bathyarchaeia archaeon]
MYDTLIRDGRIIDGCGNPWYRGDVALKDGIIAEVGEVDSGADEIIDADGKVVAPGFIDTHSHSDLMIISEPEARQKIMQGITTEVLGQDGLGEAPMRDELLDDWRRYLSGLNGDPDIVWDWRSFSEYLNRVEESEPATNIVSLVGHGNIRLLAMGMDDRAPTDSELSHMKRLMEEAMLGGAFGMSTGLIYPPCVYSETDELIELCKVVAREKGIFVVHMRDEGARLLESIREVAEVGAMSGVPVNISHFKSSGRENWGRSEEALKLLEEYRSGGVDMSFDQYPYTAGSTFLSSLLPSWTHEGGTGEMLDRLMKPEVRDRIRGELTSGKGRTPEWESLIVTSVKTESNKPLEGMNLADIASMRGHEPVEVLMDIVLEEDNAATMVSFTMAEDDVKRIMRHPLGMACTDGIVLGKPHPRVYGSFPRILGRYVRQEGVMRLEEAIGRMTSKPSQRFGIMDRGILRPGFRADIVVFDSESIIDTATFEDPIQYPRGIEHVIVNGITTVRGGEYTGDRCGMVLRH